MIILRILLGLGVFIVPCCAAAWIGSRLKSGFLGFFLAWFLTPLLTGFMLIVLWPLMLISMDPNSDGTVVFALPLIGIVTGLASGTAASILAARRNQMSLPDSGAAE